MSARRGTRTRSRVSLPDAGRGKDPATARADFRTGARLENPAARVGFGIWVKFMGEQFGLWIIFADVFIMPVAVGREQARRLARAARET